MTKTAHQIHWCLKYFNQGKFAFLSGFRQGSRRHTSFSCHPGITDTSDNVDDMAEFISNMRGLREINLLPFHDVSEKYHRLDREYLMTVRKSPPQEKLLEIKEKFESIGLRVKI